MNKVTVWHNPRCSKSRNALELLEQKGINPKVIKYLETPPSKEEIIEVLAMLDIEPIMLMRTKEEIYKEMGLKDIHDNETLINAMVSHPKLIERPIVIKDGKAVIGRPTENIINIL